MPRNESPLMGLFLCARRIGLPDRDRTCDPQLRRLLLYPTELRAVKTQKALEWAFVVWNKPTLWGCAKKWSERRDSNSRPSAPKADALPGCATLRLRYSNPQTQVFRDLRRKNLDPALQQASNRLAAITRWAYMLQLPRVMGMPMSPGTANCLASSSLASELRCTSSGPSAKRKVRWCA